MFQTRSLTLFRVRGVPVRAHWTLLLILPYLALVISLQFGSLARLAGVEGEQLRLPPLVWGAILAVGLMASVTVHELAHTLVAIRFGGRVKSITLMIIGGVSQIARMPRRASQEAIMAVVGPVTSLVLGFVLYLAFVSSAHAPVDLQMAFFYLAAMNVTLGIFNLVPAFPMDGGRVLRALLATRIDHERATAIATKIGVAFAIGLGFLGLWSMNFLLMIIAVFIYTGARGELEQERMRNALAEVRMNELVPPIRPPLPVIGRGETLARAVARMRQLDRLELLVVDDTGAPVDVVSAAELATLPPAVFETTVAGALAQRRPPHHALVAADAAASDALQHAIEAGAEYFVVVDDVEHPAEVVALLDAEELGKAVMLRTLARRIHAEAVIAPTIHRTGYSR